MVNNTTKPHLKTYISFVMKHASSLFLLICLFGLLAFSSHPFYLSICQINFNSKSESLEISLKVFTTDLASALKEKEHGELFIGEEKEHEQADAYITTYLKERFTVEIDEKPLNFEYLGKETEGDATWCYLEISTSEDFDNLRVTNRIFIDLFEGQKNIIHVKKGENEQSILLKKGNESESITF